MYGKWFYFWGVFFRFEQIDLSKLNENSFCMWKVNEKYLPKEKYNSGNIAHLYFPAIYACSVSNNLRKWRNICTIMKSKIERTLLWILLMEIFWFSTWKHVWEENAKAVPMFRFLENDWTKNTRTQIHQLSYWCSCSQDNALYWQFVKIH